MPDENLFDRWRPVMDYTLRYAGKAANLADKIARAQVD
jgi:hypothetical protein